LYYRSQDNRLVIGDHFASDLAREYGTPVFVTDQRRLEENYNRLDNAFNSRTETRVIYACKANTNLAILKVLETLGAGIDAVSPGEIMAALKAGFPKDRIMFTGPNPSEGDLDFIVESGVRINIDSFTMLEKLAKRLEGGDTWLSFRVNPHVVAGHHEHCITAGKVSKFGLPTSMVVDAYQRAQELGLGENMKGIHCHIGSGILETEPFFLALDAMCEISKQVEEKTGIDLEIIDIGGGYGVPYKPEEKDLDVEDVAEELVKRFKQHFPSKLLGIEPGRYLVADTTALLTTVNTVKHTDIKTYVGVDAGFNNLVRPAMYGSYHHLLVADNVESDVKMPVDIAGPLCESGDIFLKDYPVPPLKEGAVLALLNAGAYGFTMSSNYNMRPMAAEVLVNGDKKALIREEQPLEDLLKYQRIPDWL
jgi:diaminopimelate decarboxylase